MLFIAAICFCAFLNATSDYHFIGVFAFYKFNAF